MGLGKTALATAWSLKLLTYRNVTLPTTVPIAGVNGRLDTLEQCECPCWTSISGNTPMSCALPLPSYYRTWCPHFRGDLQVVFLSALLVRSSASSCRGWNCTSPARLFFFLHKATEVKVHKGFLQSLVQLDLWPLTLAEIVRRPSSLKPCLLFNVRVSLTTCSRQSRCRQGTARHILQANQDMEGNQGDISSAHYGKPHPLTTPLQHDHTPCHPTCSKVTMVSTSYTSRGMGCTLCVSRSSMWGQHLSWSCCPGELSSLLCVH